MIYLLFKLAVQKIPQRDAGQGILIIFCRKSGVSVGKLHTDVRGRGKRISLYMINGENIIIERIAAFQSFVGRIAFFVDRM